jgi:hypothetical protein
MTKSIFPLDTIRATQLSDRSEAMLERWYYTPLFKVKNDVQEAIISSSRTRTATFDDILA